MTKNLRGLNYWMRSRTKWHPQSIYAQSAFSCNVVNYAKNVWLAIPSNSYCNNYTHNKMNINSHRYTFFLVGSQSWPMTTSFLFYPFRYPNHRYWNLLLVPRILGSQCLRIRKDVADWRRRYWALYRFVVWIGRNRGCWGSVLDCSQYLNWLEKQYMLQIRCHFIECSYRRSIIPVEKRDKICFKIL